MSNAKNNFANTYIDFTIIYLYYLFYSVNYMLEKIENYNKSE